MIARWPVAAWRPVSHEGHRFTFPPLGWVLHVAVCTGSLWAGFERASDRFSHLWVARDGRAEQYAPLDRWSWAQSEGNGTYWSVETEGYPDEALTDAQLDTLAAWHLFSRTADRVAHRPGEVGIGAHFMGGAAWGGHSCPDPVDRDEGAGPRSRQRAEIVRRAVALRAGPPAPTPPPQEDDMTVYVAPDGPDKPGDGYLAVTGTGVYPVRSLLHWQTLASGGATLTVIPRRDWAELRGLVTTDTP